MTDLCFENSNSWIQINGWILNCARIIGSIFERASIIGSFPKNIIAKLFDLKIRSNCWFEFHSASYSKSERIQFHKILFVDINILLVEKKTSVMERQILVKKTITKSLILVKVVLNQD